MDGFECAKLIAQLWEHPALSNRLKLSEVTLRNLSDHTLELSNKNSASNESQSITNSMGGMSAIQMHWKDLK